MTTDPKRLNKILCAVVAGATKDEFKFESDDERRTWDVLVTEVAEIEAKGYIVDIPSE